MGSGASREAAEKSALGSLVAFFEQNIQVDESVSVSYQQAVRSGAAAAWSENTAIDSMISTSAGLDSLVGAEIGDVLNMQITRTTINIRASKSPRILLKPITALTWRRKKK